MKKITLALLAVATIALGACAGNKVSAEKFAEEAKKVEEEHYTEATVQYELKEVFLTSEEASGTIKYTRDDEGGWTTTSEDSNAKTFETYLEANVKTFDPADASGEEMPDGIQMDVAYYVNPFKVVVSAKGTVESSGATVTVDLKGEYKFDKCGCMTYAYSDMVMDMEAAAAKMSMTYYVKANISYK